MIGVNELAVVDEPYRTPCRAVMLTCVDYRFLRPACDLLEREGLLGSTDLIAWPGGAMALRSEDAGALLSALELAVTLHAPPTMLLVAHMDCGRLGGSSRFGGVKDESAALEAGLRDVAAVARSRLPDTRIRLIRLAEGEQSEVPLPFVPVGEETIADTAPPFPRTSEDAT